MSNTLSLLDSIGVAEDGISTAYPETFMDDIRGAYGADADAAAAKISVLEADLAAAKAQILTLQAHNYELMTSAVPVEETTVETPGEDDPSGDDAPEDEGVDSLFGNKKDDE